MLLSALDQPCNTTSVPLILEEIIWVAGATDGINLVAQAWGREHIEAGDVILITRMEHHANIVPWQMLAKERGAKVEAVNILADGTLDEDDFQKKLKLNPKMVAFMHVSNTLGTINDAQRFTQMAKSAGATVLIDGSQALPHMMVDVVELGCDFYVFSGHKAYGPTGIGVLYGRKDILEAMNPWRGGGEMIDVVSLEEGTTYAGSPAQVRGGHATHQRCCCSRGSFAMVNRGWSEVCGGARNNLVCSGASSIGKD
jgi:cysteine desulfurase/selenocysteine lyase